MSKNLIVLLLFVLCFVYSCDTGTKITYSYNNIEIKRINKSGKTTFYYNKVIKDVPKLWVEYSGINDGFSGDGYFQSSNLDTSKFEYKRILSHQAPVLRENVCTIQLSTRHEQEKNLQTGTKVKAVYHEDKQ
ncbi:hypothetical protein EYV94_27265 [Puteibacter caeruleilacunae]|nr:hypothetical protein EYV94_27265 [Puteibacter caeruleilacunae]